MAMVRRTAAPVPASTQSLPSSTIKPSSFTQTGKPTPVFVTPALTTTFTPPPECTSNHLTMLRSQQWKVWANEPYPVPNTTVSDCYPHQFMTSYMQGISNTIVPAFSPLVCPDNYHTVFQQSMSQRPLYVACCPSSYQFHPPVSATAGRPAFGGTCYSNMASMTLPVTSYDNTSSVGVQTMTFSASAQAYAHPIDGFAMKAQATTTGVILATGSGTEQSFPTSLSSSSSSSGSDTLSPSISTGAKAGIAIGAAALFVLVASLILLFLRGRSRSNHSHAQQYTNDSAYKSHPFIHPSSQPAYSPWRSHPLDEKNLPPTPPSFYQPTHADAFKSAPAASEIGQGIAWAQTTRGVQELPARQVAACASISELDASPQRASVFSHATSALSMTAPLSPIGAVRHAPQASKSSFVSQRHWPQPPARRSLSVRSQDSWESGQSAYSVGNPFADKHASPTRSVRDRGNREYGGEEDRGWKNVSNPSKPQRTGTAVSKDSVTIPGPRTQTKGEHVFSPISSNDGPAAHGNRSW